MTQIMETPMKITWVAKDIEPLAKASSGGDSFTLEDQEDASLRLRKIVIGKSCIHSMK